MKKWTGWIAALALLTMGVVNVDRVPYNFAGFDLEVEEEGGSIDTAVTVIDCIGSDITCAQTTPGEISITVSGGVNPSTQVATIFEDWITTLPGSIYSWGVTLSGTGATVTPSVTNDDASHPGNILLGTGSDTTGRATIQLANSEFIPQNDGTVFIGGGAINIEGAVFVRVLSAVSNEFDFFWGLCDRLGAGNCQDGVFFHYDRDQSVNWLRSAADDNGGAGGITETATSTAVVAGSWIKLRIQINAAGTSAEYFVNGSSVGTTATDMPTDRWSVPSMRIEKSLGGIQRIVDIDYYFLEYFLTTPR